jgi:hypothetical protein
MSEKVRRLQGKVLNIERTSDSKIDEEGNKWQKCILTVELTNFSQRTPDEVFPQSLKGNKVRLVRYCLFDWHYGLGVRKTLDPSETESVLTNTKTKTVYW